MKEKRLCAELHQRKSWTVNLPSRVRPLISDPLSYGILYFTQWSKLSNHKYGLLYRDCHPILLQSWKGNLLSVHHYGTWQLWYSRPWERWLSPSIPRNRYHADGWTEFFDTLLVLIPSVMQERGGLTMYSMLEADGWTCPRSLLWSCRISSLSDLDIALRLLECGALSLYLLRKFSRKVLLDRNMQWHWSTRRALSRKIHRLMMRMIMMKRSF